MCYPTVAKPEKIEITMNGDICQFSFYNYIWIVDCALFLSNCSRRTKVEPIWKFANDKNSVSKNIEQKVKLLTTVCIIGEK